MRYRKRELAVDAWQWGGREITGTGPSWIYENNSVRFCLSHHQGARIEVRTPHGIEAAFAYDWITKNAAGELGVVASEVFDAAYEKVGESDAAGKAGRTVAEMVTKYLKDNGLDGLQGEGGDCTCSVADELMNCDFEQACDQCQGCFLGPDLTGTYPAKGYATREAAEAAETAKSEAGEENVDV